MRAIKYSNGETDNTENIVAAMTAIMRAYPQAVFYTQCGNDVTPKTTSRVLAWENEGASYNDDGSKAIASIEEGENE